MGKAPRSLRLTGTSAWADSGRKKRGSRWAAPFMNGMKLLNMMFRQRPEPVSYRAALTATISVRLIDEILHRLAFCRHREKAVNASGENLYGG
jgi:hypothetical protein